MSLIGPYRLMRFARNDQKNSCDIIREMGRAYGLQELLKNVHSSIHNPKSVGDDVWACKNTPKTGASRRGYRPDEDFCLLLIIKALRYHRRRWIIDEGTYLTNPGRRIKYMW